MSPRGRAWFGVGVAALAIGATLAWRHYDPGTLLTLLVARYLLRDAVEARFGKALAPIVERATPRPAPAAPAQGVRCSVR
jgi:hypothetical protein